MILNGFQIRKANKDDIDDIVRLENEGFKNGEQESREILAERLNTFNDGFLVLVDENGCVVGYISSEIWESIENMTEKDFTLNHSIIQKHSSSGNTLYISSLVLSKDLKGKGWGHILFDYFIDNIVEFYPTLKNAVLLVSNNWETAQKIYRKKGFSEMFVLKDFFKPVGAPNHDGIVMKVNLRT